MKRTALLISLLVCAVFTAGAPYMDSGKGSAAPRHTGPAAPAAEPAQSECEHARAVSEVVLGFVTSVYEMGRGCGEHCAELLKLAKQLSSTVSTARDDKDSCCPVPQAPTAPVGDRTKELEKLLDSTEDSLVNQDVIAADERDIGRRYLRCRITQLEGGLQKT